MVRRLVFLLFLALGLYACGSDNVIVLDNTLPDSPALTSSSTSTAPTTTLSVSTTGEPFDQDQPLFGPSEDTLATGEQTQQQVAESAGPLTLSDIPLAQIPGRIAITGPGSNAVYVVGPGREPLLLAQNPQEVLQQPTWSPDGGRVAWSRSAGSDSWVMVSSLADGQTESYPAPNPMFYLQWHPDGQALGVLGPADPSGTGLAVLDLDQGEVTPKTAATSFFFQWSPGNRNQLIAHVDAARLEILDTRTDERTFLENTAGNFQAPVWTPDGLSVLYVRAGVGENTDSSQLVRQRLDTGAFTVLAEGTGDSFSFALSPDGQRLAFSVAGQSTLNLLDLASGVTEQVDAPNLFVWQWSPDSQKILLFGLDPTRLSVGVYQSGTVTDFQGIIPTDNFFRNYLVFWGQYHLSLSLWAPDSSAFVFAASNGGPDRIYLQQIDEDFPALLIPGSMAAFSPTFDLPAT